MLSLTAKTTPSFYACNSSYQGRKKLPKDGWAITQCGAAHKRRRQLRGGGDQKLVLNYQLIGVKNCCHRGRGLTVFKNTVKKCRRLLWTVPCSHIWDRLDLPYSHRILFCSIQLSKSCLHRAYLPWYSSGSAGCLPIISSKPVLYVRHAVRVFSSQ